MKPLNTAKMSNLTAFFFVWSCSLCYAVQVFAKDAHGKVTWKDSPVWRDRSVVPTPPKEDVEAYKKRAEIPHLYPKIVKHVYIGPENERKRNKKKNIIQRMFFSLPIGAELPLYYTHKQAKSHKKSTVASSEVSDSEGSRYFAEETNGPFRSNTWGLQQQLAENEELSPDVETRTIAGQNLLPNEGGMKYHGIGGQYLRPRTVDKYRIFKNTGQFFKRPSRTEGILNVYKRSKAPELKETRRDLTQTKETSLSESRKLENGYVTKGKNAKKSGLPKGTEQSFPSPWLL